MYAIRSYYEMQGVVHHLIDVYEPTVDYRITSYNVCYTKLLRVKGHDGHEQNERCDVLATTAADGDSLLEDTGATTEEI